MVDTAYVDARLGSRLDPAGPYDPARGSNTETSGVSGYTGDWNGSSICNTSGNTGTTGARSAPGPDHPKLAGWCLPRRGPGIGDGAGHAARSRAGSGPQSMGEAPMNRRQVSISGTRRWKFPLFVSPMVARGASE